MYAIIYGKKENDDDRFFVTNNNGSIFEYSFLKDAIKDAKKIELSSVIDLEAIKNNN